MHIDEYIAARKEELDQLALHWKRSHVNGEEGYDSLEMDTYWDWKEQEDAYLELIEENPSLYQDND